MSENTLDEANRFAIVVTVIVVALVALLVVLLAWAEPAASIGRIGDLAGYLRDHETRSGKAIVTLGASVVVLLMATIALIELTPPATQKMRLRSVGSGDASLTTKQIAERVEREVRAVPHVIDCTAIVAARGRRVELVLDLHVGAEADLAATANEACRRAHELVEQRMNIELAQPPRARLHYRELRLHESASESRLGTLTSSGWERPANAKD